MDDTFYMEMALSLAEKGKGFTSPNPMVGAVVVKDGTIVGKGFHEVYGGPHAEVHAIDHAGSQARGATLYVTLEPCNHTGKTPPCTHKILEAGITEVVMAMADPNPLASGGADFLRQKGVRVRQGVCEDQSRRLNEIFITYATTKKPFVILKYASTLDGRIATRTGDSKWISGPVSRAYTHEIRHLVDGIMVGMGTILADDPSLTTRIAGFKGRDPRRIILDTGLRIPENAKILHLESDSDTILVSGLQAQEDPHRLDKKRRLEKRGVTVLEVPMKNGLIDLDKLMGILGSMGISSLLIEGGSRVLSEALQAGIVNKVMLFYAPKLLGGDDGAPVCKGKGPEMMKDAIGLEHMTFRPMGEDLMIEAYVTPSVSKDTVY
ncbi:MAG: bifunctional diaminohydroxyphosphoribosylaminopyrimidine deaminase/5-amino-6-(5-phosphoribosylamino)uracil reductase RibD [Proteobacteria bacterium]|nr:bifunctional diaminohydroxyphosphoribosylaminopyrimidine deaminase/5-amino-6-(5-phosphoribosylamino)uracil reductase RibD [Pseudomonadota bacterium]